MATTWIRYHVYYDLPLLFALRRSIGPRCCSGLAIKEKRTTRAGRSVWLRNGAASRPFRLDDSEDGYDWSVISRVGLHAHLEFPIEWVGHVLASTLKE